MRATLMISLLTVLAVLGFGIWFLTAPSAPVPARGSSARKNEVEKAPIPRSLGPLPMQEPNVPSGVGEEIPSHPDEGSFRVSDASPSSPDENGSDEEIARFDKNALEFDLRRSILRDELQRGLLDPEASLLWESRTQDLMAPDLADVQVRAQCSATVCELILQSPHPSGTLLAHSARFLRELHEGTIGAREIESDVNDTTPEGEQIPEGFSVLIRRDDQEGGR